MLVKVEKRRREEGKETVFHYCGNELDGGLLDNFKKRRGDSEYVFSS